ncbi:MAG: hypothetical protein A2452_07845 [Candidatus Firestonebacteria bacterium RIFOXYC2_FULL_39_67]|nr:MAG: hypothetical protein A2536_08220 [Candidatus Firestonebacteria bacterium RIFOXYD2_FULL_39_29]OGF56754.1 MAG: hypothetical protein A2452_07845 [Candidatus Firestonebacteria bacterium RIFOXYC2_FULL_39_67]
MQIEGFEKEIEQALKSIPPEFIEKLKNIQITADDSAPQKNGSLLLGLYHGVPLKDRSAVFEPLMPDKITLYKQSLELISKTPEELRKNIKDTVVHEIGHYFGLEEKDIRKRGY